MTSRFLFAVLALSLFCKPIYAGQSTITDAEGNACMGDDKSRKQTEQAALTDAKKSAVDRAATYIKSETQVKDFVLQKDIIEAYQNATVKVLQEVEKNWYKDPNSGECYKLKIKAEVIPDEKAIAAMAMKPETADNPNAPLSVKVWTEKKEYKAGEQIKVYIKGNKPFYARVLYKDAGGEMVQLLPNPYRNDNYFNGGAIYELPSGNDKFELAISPPFGEENVIVYASSQPLGDIEVQGTRGVYAVKTKSKDVGARTRGVKLMEKSGDKASVPAEFVETVAAVKTGK